MVEHFFAPETSPERLFVMLITNLTSSFKILVGFSGGGGGIGGRDSDSLTHQHLP